MPLLTDVKAIHVDDACMEGCCHMVDIDVGNDTIQGILKSDVIVRLSQDSAVSLSKEASNHFGFRWATKDRSPIRVGWWEPIIYPPLVDSVEEPKVIEVEDLIWIRLGQICRMTYPCSHDMIVMYKEGGNVYELRTSMSGRDLLRLSRVYVDKFHYASWGSKHFDYLFNTDEEWKWECIGHVHDRHDKHIPFQLCTNVQLNYPSGYETKPLLPQVEDDVTS
jgi:hypothetical protein